MTLTSTAAAKIREAVATSEKPADGLRIKVVGGGCSGLQYRLELDSERKGDKVFQEADAKLLIDRKSYLYLNGTEVDYSDALMGAGFRLSNPNVKRTCGCGESFVV